MDISVIIVSYNVRYYLEQCISSVYAAASGINIEVFVVDNASSDGTIAYIRKKLPSAAYPTLHLMANAHNAGF
ncbi:MAG: glycosyltransferase, partial [Bacteroidaceae bacterium]|nr:glycosyltransferase [Bacteroidaceae bacterium]